MLALNALALLALGTGCIASERTLIAANDTAKPPLKIGFVCSLSSVAAGGGAEMQNGIKLFMEQNQYTIAGRKVDLIIVNDESDPLIAKAKVKELAEHDKVDILTGFQFSNVGVAVTPVCEQLKVPTVIAFSSANDITLRPNYKWVIRTSRSAGQTSYPFGDWVYRKLGYKRIAALAVDYSYGYNAVGSFQKSFEGAGGKIVQKLWVPIGFSDFRPYIGRIEKDVDAVLLVIAGESSRTIMRQYHESGLSMPLLGDSSTFDEDMLRAGSVNIPLNSFSSSAYTPAIDVPANKAFVKAYQAKYHVRPSHYSESTYVVGMWIKKALESINGDTSDKEKVLAALKKVTLDAPRGPMKLDTYGNPIENIYITQVERVNGELQNKIVYTARNSSQFWKYSPKEILNQPNYSRDYPPCRYCKK